MSEVLEPPSPPMSAGAIWRRALVDETAEMTSARAEHILTLDFTQSDQQHMAVLNERAKPVGNRPGYWREILALSPREQSWEDHFRWDGPILIGRTALGRTTIEVLSINGPGVVEHRRALIEESRFP